MQSVDANLVIGSPYILGFNIFAKQQLFHKTSVTNYQVPTEQGFISLKFGIFSKKKCPTLHIINNTTIKHFCRATPIS
jgi:hypothetical protein